MARRHSGQSPGLNLETAVRAFAPDASQICSNKPRPVTALDIPQLRTKPAGGLPCEKMPCLLRGRSSALSFLQNLRKGCTTGDLPHNSKRSRAGRIRG